MRTARHWLRQLHGRPRRDTHRGRAALDCADLCAATERLLARHGGLEDDGAVAATVEAAIAACTASAAACAAHADHHAHCAAHSRAGSACAETLTALRRD